MTTEEMMLTNMCRLINMVTQAMEPRETDSSKAICSGCGAEYHYSVRCECCNDPVCEVCGMAFTACVICHKTIGPCCRRTTLDASHTLCVKCLEEVVKHEQERMNAE